MILSRLQCRRQCLTAPCRLVLQSLTGACNKVTRPAPDAIHSTDYLLRERAMPKRISAESLVDDTDEITADLAAEAEGTLARLRGQADQLVDRLRPRVDAVAGYVRDEPTKAVLISAAVGAGLMGLIALMVRSNRSSLSLPSSVPTTMSSIRSAAMDLAGQAQGIASKALDKAQKRADKEKKHAMSAANDAASDLGDTVADAWKSLREQAGPMVDKIRPQIDAATAYVKDDPARATMGAVAAGAVLLGLMTLLGGSKDD